MQKILAVFISFFLSSTLQASNEGADAAELPPPPSPALERGTTDWDKIMNASTIEDDHDSYEHQAEQRPVVQPDDDDNAEESDD